jgi:hypothetical protein
MPQGVAAGTLSVDSGSSAGAGDREGVDIMKPFVLLLVVTSFLALGVGSALARTSAQPKTVTVVMHDPGCHVFAVNGKFLKSLTVTGPVRLANVDERALLVAGHSGVTQAPVGKQITLARGVYHITMVKQAPDDNHLTLVVR